MKKLFSILTGVALFSISTVAYATGTSTIPWFTTNNASTTPYFINGVAPTLNVLSTATSTFSGGIRVSAGCVQVGSSCLGASGTSGVGTSTNPFMASYFVATSTGKSTFAGYVGIGTTAPAEILSLDNTSVSNYTTLDITNHSVHSILDSDSVDSFNGLTGYTYLGSKTNNPLVLGFNNQGQCGIYSDNSLDTLFDCYPPGNGLEMTYTNSLPNSGFGGSGTTFVDHYLMDYGSGTGMQAGTIYARTSTAALFPDILDGYWEQGKGPEASNTQFFSIVVPSGQSAFGSFSSSSPSVNAIQRTGAVVQLGASSTASTELTVYGNDTTTTNNLFNVQRSGNVGIGTSTPGELLDIYGQYPFQRITNSNTSQFAGAGLVLANDIGSLGNQASTIFYDGINDVSASQGYFGIDQGTKVGGGINHWLLFNYNTQTASFYTNGTEKLTILSNGNIGVGTTSPWTTLSVKGSSDLGNSASAGYFTGTTTATSTLAGGLQALALNVTSTSATSTLANGIKLTGGCVQVGATCLTSGGGTTQTFIATTTASNGTVNIEINSISLSSGNKVLIWGYGGNNGGNSNTGTSKINLYTSNLGATSTLDIYTNNTDSNTYYTNYAIYTATTTVTVNAELSVPAQTIPKLMVEVVPQ